jgi:hypothetical protein
MTTRNVILLTLLLVSSTFFLTRYVFTPKCMVHISDKDIEPNDFTLEGAAVFISQLNLKLKESQKYAQALAKKYHDITLQVLKNLVHDFVSEPKKLNSIAKNTSAGGYFRRETIETALAGVTGDRAGLMFYFCYHDKAASGSAVDSLYIAFKAIDNFDPDNIGDNHLLDGDKLAKSVNNFVYTEAGTDMSDVDVFLGKGTKISEAVQETPGYWTRRRMNDFTRYVHDGLNPQFNFNNFTHTFIHKSEILELLKESDAMGVKFYFGLDKTEPENKIRIILVCINAGGVLDVLTSGNYRYSNNIERSWP